MQTRNVGRPAESPAGRVPDPEAVRRARAQLRRVLRILAVLDVSVVLLVILLAVAKSVLRWTDDEFLLLVLTGVVLVLAARIALAVNLRRRPSGSP